MSGNNFKPAFTSRLACRDLRAAVGWLEKVFDFKITMMATMPDGGVVHAEMQWGNGVIHIGSEWENIQAPGSVSGANTQNICVHVEDDLDEHCAHVRAAGGQIIQEPQDQFHGDRIHRVRDPEGHIWTFSQKLRDVTAEEMAAAVPGMKGMRLMRHI